MLLDNFKLKGMPNKAALMVAETVVREELAARTLRGEDYQYNWELYNGEHAKHFRQREKESDKSYKYRRDNSVINNLCAFTVDLSSKYLYGKASKVVRNFSKKNAETNEKLIELAYDKAKIDSFFLDAATKTSIFGEQLVRFIAVDSDTKLQVTEVSDKNTYPHPVLLDPRYNFAKVNLYGKLEAVVSFYSAVDFTTGQESSVMELIVDDSRWTWKSSEKWSYNFGNALRLNLASVPFFRQLATPLIPLYEENPVTLAREFVLFVNSDNKKSDLSAIGDLNISLDEALTDKRHVFQRLGWPQLVTSVDLSNVENSPNATWEVAPDFADNQKVGDKFEYLTWDSKQDHQQIYVDNLERAIMILSNTAAISTGDLKAIGQLRSGAALITAHSVAIHKTEAKQIVWDRNEKEFYRAMVGYDSYMHNEAPDIRYPDFKVFIRFPKDFVPGAEADRVNIQNTQFAGHLKPLNDLILEEYGNLTDAEVEEKRAQIIKDSIEVIDSARLFESKQAEGGDTPAKPALRTPTVKSKEQPKT